MACMSYWLRVTMSAWQVRDRRGMSEFVAVGNALLAIRDERLYRR